MAPLYIDADEIMLRKKLTFRTLACVPSAKEFILELLNVSVLKKKCKEKECKSY
jgi:hypothetical protein